MANLTQFSQLGSVGINRVNQPALIEGLLWSPDMSTVRDYTNAVGDQTQVNTLTCAALTDGQTASVTVTMPDTSNIVETFTYTSVGASTGTVVATAITAQMRARLQFQAVVKPVSNAAVITLTAATAFQIGGLTNITNASVTSLTAPDVVPFGAIVINAASFANPRGVTELSRDLIAADLIRGITVRREMAPLVAGPNGIWTDGTGPNEPIPVCQQGRISVRVAEDIGGKDLYYFYAGPFKRQFSGTAGANKALLPARFVPTEYVRAGNYTFVDIL